MRHMDIRGIGRTLGLLIAVGLVFGATAMAQDAMPSGEPGFLVDGEQLELLVTGNDHGIVFTEGAAVSCDGMVYFSDITFTAGSKTARGGLLAGVIWKYDPGSGDLSVFRSPSGMSNGIKFDANCDMINAEGADYGGRRIIRHQTCLLYTSPSPRDS